MVTFTGATVVPSVPLTVTPVVQFSGIEVVPFTDGIEVVPFTDGMVVPSVTFPHPLAKAVVVGAAVDGTVVAAGVDGLTVLDGGGLEHKGLHVLKRVFSSSQKFPPDLKCPAAYPVKHNNTKSLRACIFFN